MIFWLNSFLVGGVEIGDIFAFENTGAYCMTEGIALFLSRELPKVLRLQEDGFELARDNLQTYEFNM